MFLSENISLNFDLSCLFVISKSTTFTPIDCLVLIEYIVYGKLLVYVANLWLTPKIYNPKKVNLWVLSNICEILPEYLLKENPKQF